VGFFQAALAVMAWCNSDSGLSVHDQQLMASPSQRAAVCYVCHRCVARPTESRRSLWDPHSVSGDDNCSIERRVGNISLLCLSCHDGAIGPLPPTSEEWFAGQRTLGVQPSEWSTARRIGHHPYWVTYPVAGNTDFLPLGQNPACPLPLFSDPRSGGHRISLECPTCHDIHSPDAGSYLRVNKEQFELCLCCHRELPPLSSEVYLPMQKEQAAIDSGDCRSCHDM